MHPIQLGKAEPPIITRIAENEDRWHARAPSRAAKRLVDQFAAVAAPLLRRCDGDGAQKHCRRAALLARLQRWGRPAFLWGRG